MREERLGPVKALHGSYDTKFGEGIALIFESWDEFLEYATREPTLGRYKDRPGMTSSRKPSGDWGGNVTWNQAKEMARTGWPEGEEKVKNLAGNLFDQVSGSIDHNEWVWAIEGEVFDIGMYLQGVPEHALQLHHVEGEGERQPIVKITYNCVASAGVNAESLIKCGAMALAVVRLAEHADLRAEVELQFIVGNHQNQYLEVRVPIKEPQEDLNLPELAFAMAHPAVMRRFMFAIEERGLPSWMKTFGSGYGQVLTPRKEVQGDLHVEAANAYILGKDPEKFLLEGLAKFGIHLDQDKEETK